MRSLKFEERKSFYIFRSFPIAEAGIVICYKDENKQENYIAR